MRKVNIGKKKSFDLIQVFISLINILNLYSEYLIKYLCPEHPSQVDTQVKHPITHSSHYTSSRSFSSHSIGMTLTRGYR